MKNSKLNPIPKTIRAFKYTWLREQFMSYSDKEIKELLKKIIKNDRSHIAINLGYYNQR